MILVIITRFLTLDYLKNEEEFEKRVEHDATHFKPLGEKIYSYKRKVALGKGKGKADVPSEELNEDDEDVVTYEVYHVSNIHDTSSLTRWSFM